MNSKTIEQIQISKIRITNPRDRNRKTFVGIAKNIGLVGLKKPVTVFHCKKMRSDGTEYDLVCGQGRIEAIVALGGRSVPAVVTDAPLAVRHLMSLVENIARKRPPTSALIPEVRRLQDSGLKNEDIAATLGLGRRYIGGVVRLLRYGEDDLVARVAAGTVPLHLAIKIATSSDKAVQKAVSAANSSGGLRPAKLAAVQKIITRRAAKDKADGPAAGSDSTEIGCDPTGLYELQTDAQRTLMRRASLVRERLAILGHVFSQLLANKSFVELLTRQQIDSIPEILAARVRNASAH